MELFEKLRGRLASAGAAIALTMFAAGAAQAAELIVMSSGGGFDDAMRETVIKPFMAANPGVTVTLAPPANASEQIIKLRASRGRSGIDISLVGGGWHLQGMKDGLYEPIDPVLVPNLANLHPGLVAEGNFAAAVASGSIGLAYLPGRVPRTPTSWNDLWDPAFQGKVAIPNPSYTAGLMLIDHVRRAAGSACGDDDATFKRLAELKSQKPLFYNLTTQVRDSLASGAVSLAVMFDSHASLLRQAGVDVKFLRPVEGAFGNPTYITIVKGTENSKLANQFINFYLDPVIQKNWAEAVFYGPSNKLTKMDPPLADEVVYGEKVNASLQKLDWPCIQQSQSRWADRWNREILGTR